MTIFLLELQDLQKMLSESEYGALFSQKFTLQFYHRDEKQKKTSYVTFTSCRTFFYICELRSGFNWFQNGKSVSDQIVSVKYSDKKVPDQTTVFIIDEPRHTIAVLSKYSLQNLNFATDIGVSGSFM